MKLFALRNKNSGFTLIELLVVILILAILAGVAISQYTTLMEKGRLSEVYAFKAELDGSQKRYQTFNSRYSASFSDLDMDIDTKFVVDATNLTLKYYAVKLTADAGGTYYTIDFTRGGSKGGVPSKFGAYVLTYTVPSTVAAPTRDEVSIKTCPTGSGVCDKLLK